MSKKIIGQDYSDARLRDFEQGKQFWLYVEIKELIPYMYNLSIVKEWDMRLIDKTVIPRMPWHDISLCMVRPVFKFSVLKEIFYFYCNLKTTLYSSANLFWMSHVIFVTDGISLSSLNHWTSKKHLS